MSDSKPAIFIHSKKTEHVNNQEKFVHEEFIRDGAKGLTFKYYTKTRGKKNSSYKQQDKNKKILRKEFPIITFDEVTEKVVESKLKCYFEQKEKQALLESQVKLSPAFVK